MTFASKMQILFKAVVLSAFLPIAAYGQSKIKIGDEFEAFLNGVHLASVYFPKGENITFLDAVSLGVSWGIERDTTATTGSPRGIGKFLSDKSKHIKDCVVFPDGLKEKEIVFDAQNITLREFFVEIARQTEMDLYASSAGLVFCPSDQKPKEEFPEAELEIWAILFDADRHSHDETKGEQGVDPNA